MAVTTYSNMQIVPEKFSAYTLDRTTELNRLVQAGIASSDATVGSLINGTPQGGRFITMPMFNALEGDDDVFSESEVSVSNITTKNATATLLMRQKAWGSTDLAHVLGGADPMAAIGNLVSDWWLSKEQAIYISILKGIMNPSSGALKAHVNDISAGSGDAAKISVGATLDTKQALGDHYDSLGMVFMHSAVYTALQKNQDIVTEYDATLQIQFQTYLGYRIIVDDGMPASGGVYTTYFLGSNALIRQDGTPQGFVGTETDRDKLSATDYLINRRCMVIHPRGFSWNVNATYPEGIYYPTNAMLATPANWTLAIDHKKIPMAALVHKI